MSLHDDLRELVASYGQELLGDAEQFRAALDDYLEERAILPGQANLLYDAVRLGAYERCLHLIGQGGDPTAAVETAGDALARERGTLETASSRWAVATLAHASGHLDGGTLRRLVGGPAATAPPLTASPSPSLSPTAPAPLPPTAPATARVPPVLPVVPNGTPPRRGRLLGPALAAAAVVLVVVGGYGVLAAVGDDDSPSRTDDSEDTRPPSHPSSTSTGTPALAAPGRPELSARPAYRAVAFRITSEDSGVEGDLLFERESESGWSTTDPTFRIVTRAGGEEACARVRAVRSDGDRRAVGRPVQECATSSPRTIELSSAGTSCPPSSGGRPCRNFDLEVSGFPSEQSLTARILGTKVLDSGTFLRCDPADAVCQKPLRTDRRGEGVIHEVKIFQGTEVTVQVGRLQSTAGW